MCLVRYANHVGRAEEEGKLQTPQANNETSSRTITEDTPKYGRKQVSRN